MLRTVIIFLFGAMFWQSAQAQKQDTAVLYLKDLGQTGQIVKTKDSADYILVLISPPDSSSGVRISTLNAKANSVSERANTVEEFYTNGRAKLIGRGAIALYGKQVKLILVGLCRTYYENGNKKSKGNYANGFLVGDLISYYPNGMVYTISNPISMVGSRFKLIECRDSTGTILAQNGVGKWMKFDDYFKHKLAEGTIKDSVENGEWHSFINDTAKYTLVYRNGIVISSTEPGWDKKVFMAVEQEPQFISGPAGFNAYLARTVKFPAVDRKKGTQGKAIVSFVIEKDGALSNIKALNAPSEALANAVVKAVEQSPKWTPGMQNGQPVRVQYSISFMFSLANN